VSADDPSGPVYLLSVTPAALKGLNQYQKELSVRGIPPEIVKTRVSFDTDASFPKLKFTFGGFLEADTQEIVDKLFGSDEVKEVTGESARQAVAVPKIAAPQVAPKPAVRAAVPVEEPAPAPAPAPAAAPKRGFGAPKAEAAPAVKAATKPTAKPAASVAAADDAMSLADEIAALVGEVSADDA
jgi:hypothetical protein